MGLREIKATARRDLHQAMQVPAFYLETDAADPLSVTVRVHTKFKAQGDLKGTSFNYAEMREEIPKLVFWLSELPDDDTKHPLRNSIVMISATEGYRIDSIDPPDGATVSAAVSPLKAAELVGKPVP